MNVLVTGGGTIAPIDDVRTIKNTSTGRFSAAITEACLARGARVQHVHAEGADRPFFRSAMVDLDAPDVSAENQRLDALRSRYGVARDRLTMTALRPATVGEYATTLERVLAATPFDVIFLAMAVSDYEPEPIVGKIESSSETLTIRCRKTPKIIQRVRDWAPSAYLVGFKLLSGTSPDELISRAENACLKNRADATLANDLQTIREGRHAVHLVRPGATPEPFGPGPEMTTELVARVLELARQRS